MKQMDKSIILVQYQMIVMSLPEVIKSLQMKQDIASEKDDLDAMFETLDRFYEYFYNNKDDDGIIRNSIMKTLQKMIMPDKDD